MTRKLLTLLAGLAAAAAFAGPALSDDTTPRPGDNIVIAENTTNGSSLFKFAFDIRRITGAVVDNTNAAIAYSSCVSCRTTAIAIQILLVEGSPSTFTPGNAAVAVNANCSACQTFAAAYQFVVQTDGPVRFTHAGWRQLHEIQKAIRAFEDQNLTPAEMDAQLKVLMAQLQHVLETELVPVDQQGDNQQQRGPPETRGKSETASTPTTTSTPAATTTAPTTTAGTRTTPTSSTTTTTPTTSTTTTSPATSTTTTPNATTTTTP
jgi:hypothetical protein